MNLLIATPLYPPEPGGPATYAKHLEEGLPERGISVSLAKFSEARHLPPLLRHLAYYRRVRRALRTADAVLALDPVSTGLPALLAARSLGKPFFVKVVGDYAWEQGTQRFGVTASLDEFVELPNGKLPLLVRILRAIQTQVAKSAKRVIVPSEYLRDILIAWGIPAEKIELIYNGISLPTVLPAYERSSEEFLIVSAGRRVPWKGFEAIERVAMAHPAWRVAIASGLTREATLGMMRAADAFVLNSSYEGLSHVLIEAMELGTPVVATAAGGNVTLIEDGKTGLLIPPNDDAALETALLSVESDRRGARARAEKAKERMERFSIPRMLDATALSLKENV